jgi:lysophospholipase L1-like esterase
MYRFQISAVTQPGETIALVGSVPQIGLWDEARCLRLCTGRDRYPLWWVDLDLSDQPAGSRIEYKYVKICTDGQVDWEWGANRWVPIEPEPLPSAILIEDGTFGIIPSQPYGYFAEPVTLPAASTSSDGLKVVVLGSSVALGCSAWLLRGWTWHLGQALQQRYGHQLVNVSKIGTNVGTTIARFFQAVGPEQPDIVIIALSLGNEGFASSTPQQYRAVQRRFEKGLQHLIKMTQEIGAYPVLGGVYPNSGYTAEHYRLLQETHQRMLTWGVPVLNWLAAVDDGEGRWKPELCFDPAHPNTQGHERMYEAIDLSLFQLSKANLIKQCPYPPEEHLLYQHSDGFSISTRHTNSSLHIINRSHYPYTITPDWQELQMEIQSAQLPAGVYIAESPPAKTVSSLSVQDNGRIETYLTVASTADLNFYPTFYFFDSQRSQILFYDGHIGILKVDDLRLYIINESDHEYNLHPMWQEVRAALKVMPAGVYEDPDDPNAAFRTLMIDKDGLESRVKVPAQSVIQLEYKCSLTEVSRVAIIPLGDRCAARMLLYKLEYDGPAFPFDLTRTTNIADVADIIQSNFTDMWNPYFLHYDEEAHRIYHTKWTGLSFAHEVEESDDPVNDMSPIYERMRTRYSARSKRFWYTLEKCGKALFVRTGLCDRAGVMDLVSKLENKCQGKPFWLLLISPQASEEFAQLPNVLHYNLEFNPDRMYEDAEHWRYCTEVMRGILNSLGISSKNLFWCPPTPPSC